jgi:hypothetical protein
MLILTNGYRINFDTITVAASIIHQPRLPGADKIVVTINIVQNSNSFSFERCLPLRLYANPVLQKVPGS